ncbi:MAG: hypothetical protein VB029_03175 [Anaerolineaceae bacterium]|jgi:hypothetical protein|nr:hypothetical protein [Anaerolineaceae bacterium]
MKRCSECSLLADNGDKHCPTCGTPFPYDPKVTPYSETKLLIIVVVLALAAVVYFKVRPLPLPDPTTCSRTSLNRFEAIVYHNHQKAMTILAENYISSKHLSSLMLVRRQADALAVPACLETAKQYYVDYLESIYYTAALSASWGFEPATLAAESASNSMDALKAQFDLVSRCLPNCP